MLNRKRWRKLKRGEHRYISISGKPVIIKPKNFSKWKNNKKFDRKTGTFKFKLDIVLEKVPIIKHKPFFRYSAFKLWTVAGDDAYYPQLELKAFIFSKVPLNVEKTKVELNEMIKHTKDVYYDYNNFFEEEITRRRIAYESEEISKEEFKEGRFAIITVNDDENTIRNGFPKTRKF